MKWLLIFWAAPVAFLFSWYGLSYYDINFGWHILSRDLHDLVFQVYGNILGVDPKVIPGLVLRAIIVDTAIVFGLVYLRAKRKTIGSAVRSLFGRPAKDQSAEESRDSEASLSSAP